MHLEEKMLGQQDGQVVVWGSIAADIILSLIQQLIKEEKYGQGLGSGLLPKIISEILDTFKKMPSPCGATVSHL